ncbi:unnamed protein product [Urochloa decumbens]|uniref:Uncharacterized protein n=1 Tax=Urochloa decumbens TaxID=240449 RepID=A0ABC9AYI5_9POAL
MDSSDLVKGKESDSEGGEILKLKKEAMAALVNTTAVEEAGMKRRKKVVKDRLPQGFVDYMVVTPYKPFGDIPQRRLAKRSQEFREWYATEKAKADKMLEYQQALIKQFVVKGYAEDEIEVTDG